MREHYVSRKKVIKLKGKVGRGTLLQRCIQKVSTVFVIIYFLSWVVDIGCL